MRLALLRGFSPCRSRVLSRSQPHNETIYRIIQIWPVFYRLMGDNLACVVFPTQALKTEGHRSPSECAQGPEQHCEIHSRLIAESLTFVDLAFDKGGPDADLWDTHRGRRSGYFAQWVSRQGPQRYTII